MNENQDAEPKSTVSQASPDKTSKVQQRALLVFATLFLLICLLPFVRLPFSPEQTVADGDTLSEAPTTTHDDGTLNINFLSDAGTYFEDHFAFRSAAIDLNARMRVGMLATSPTDQVIVGSDGWLYYGGTLTDYLGTKPLSERDIVNIAHNLELMQGYTEAQGASFTLLIAPNKNTLYPEHMPYYLAQGTNDSMQRLMQALEKSGINYVDAFALFGDEPAELYYRTDTHWTSEGAFLVTGELLDALGSAEVTLSGQPEPETLTGDLELMLYPLSNRGEDALALETGTWQYSGEARSVEEASIETTGEGEGTLLMYRDSFANNLIPLIAPAFERAYFTKLVPYNLMQVQGQQADAVVIERAERHISLLADDAPLMLAPTLKLDTSSALSATATAEQNSHISWYPDEDFRAIEGWLDEAAMATQSQIFVEIQGPSAESRVFAPFYLSRSEGNNASSYGFKLYLDERSLTEGAYTFRVLVVEEGTGTVQLVLEETLQYQ